MLELKITYSEAEYLKSLLDSELFQLAGLKNISKNKEINNELKIAEKIEKKLDNLELAAA